MTRSAPASVSIQTSSHSSPAPPPWFGEVALLVSHLQKQGVLDAINAPVRFARRRFGYYDVLDLLALLFGYAISGERTLEAFYKRLQPWASAFLALFGRDRLPSRSALSRWLAALDQATVEALRTLFLSDLLARRLTSEEPSVGLWDRMDSQWLVFDVDGTRQARLRRKRGEIVRTRTTVLQAHTSQWLGTFGNAGNGEYRAELHRAAAAIGRYVQAHHLPPERAVLRLDGQYGTGAVLADLGGFSYATRGQDYHLLDRDEVQARLHLPLIRRSRILRVGFVAPSMTVPLLPLGPKGGRCRVVGQLIRRR